MSLLQISYQYGHVLQDQMKKLAELGDAIAISNLKLSMTDSLTHSPTD